ncbi:hypothetical protein GF319_00225 [Candidatus Bathyarchaeota archaeon]|nr:hypothetical protein [Candidatus Bathyarchaeota archaeon]
MKENFIRSIELGVALTAGYMGAITMVQTTLYAKIITKIKASFIGELLKSYLNYIDLAVIALVLILIFYLWRKADDTSFARIFNLNMLLFFSAVLDYSRFNWIGLIFNLKPEPEVSANWVFGVGLLLQMTYLFLRYTLRFRYTRDELLGRGATADDINQVSRGQMGYLAIILFLTSLFTAGIFFSVPFIDRAISQPFRSVPVPHLVIGFIVVMGISASLIFYLRGSIIQKSSDNKVEEDKVDIQEI